MGSPDDAGTVIPVISVFTETNKTGMITMEGDGVNQEPAPVELSSEVMGFIENIARFYEGYGIPRIGGRMFGLFLVTVDPLSAQTIADLLHASRSSVSTNIRGLMANGWVERVTFPGDRSEYFRFSPNAWECVLEHRKKGMVPLRKLTEQAQSALPAGHPAREQLKVMSDWVDLQIQSHEAVLAAWRKRMGRPPLD